ncbi:MAG: NAD-dependent deacylase [Flavobacteriales bacterium]|nr:NAD-dependent deacylase [Flavobacteriales bacterium]
MKRKKSKIVVLSGAGISAESGLGTFRDKGGLWDKHDINDVATPEAWRKNPELVLEFYNMRRELVLEAKPNQAHSALVRLERYFDVQIITQNIDDLHERAGSKNILHLHGEILFAQSILNTEKVYPVKGSRIELGDLAPDGGQLRPHVVWFGEAVPKMIDAEQIMKEADILIVVGTSLNVYPAANLVYACPPHAEKYIVDLNELSTAKQKNLHHLKGKASEKLPELVDQLIQESKN